MSRSTSSRQSARLVCCLLACTAAFAQWHGIYEDGPIALRLKPERSSYIVGDTFRLRVTAVNTSDRDVLIRRNWKEQLVFYHLRPETKEMVEWPGYVNTATWLDSGDVVMLRPGGRYSVTRQVRVWTPDDAATFDFRVKLVGVKDYGRRFRTWQGFAWSNAVKLTVRPASR